MHRSPPRPSPAPYHARSQSQSLISPPTHRSRRPSLSNTMHWLSRSNSPPNSAPPYAPSKPVRVPEPKRARTIDIISPRSGTLGAGATVVRTPDEALRETGVRLTPESPPPTLKPSTHRSSRDKKEKHSSVHSSNDVTPSAFLADGLEMDTPPTPASPPLPPLPTLDSEDEETLAEPDSPAPKSPPRPTRAPPPPPSPVLRPRSPSLRSSLKVKTMSTAEDAPSIPPLPAHAAVLNQPPPFSAILISDPPSVAMDASKTIVTIETCTETFKTTLATIRSRPSLLAKFISSLFFHPHHDSIASIYSAESDDLSTYRRHLTSQGLLPHSSTVHLFLDRASAPYAHILAYLRTPVVDGQPEVLPRALQLQSAAPASARLESLIEVRDEAAFLALDGLHRLCTDEIRMRFGPRLHSRGQSSSAASVQSQHASIYSSHTLAEHPEHQPVPTSPLPTGADSFSNSTPRPKHQHSHSTSTKRSPTPQSWDVPLDQSRHSLKPPPAGWI